MPCRRSNAVSACVPLRPQPVINRLVERPLRAPSMRYTGNGRGAVHGAESKAEVPPSCLRSEIEGLSDCGSEARAVPLCAMASVMRWEGHRCVATPTPRRHRVGRAHGGRVA
eukprot:6881574-Prymnesium_polylepis.1